MKNVAIVLFFTIIGLQIVVGQSEKMVGTYELKFGNEDAFSKRTITLNADGTFLFHSYRHIKQGIPPEENKYAKGFWKTEENRIYFSTEAADIDEKHTLNFTNSKARFDTKSPRDKSDRIVKISLRFYECEIFWIQGNVMIKVE